jgi:hypothetical protein
LDVNLLNLKNYLTAKGFNLKVEGKLGLTFVLQDVKASVMKSGVTIIEGAKEKDEALKLFSELTGY